MPPAEPSDVATPLRPYDIYREMEVDTETPPIKAFVFFGTVDGRNHEDALRHSGADPDIAHLVVTQTSSKVLALKTKTTTSVVSA